MKSFIESLYYGEISPCSMPVPNTKRYIEAQKELGKYETELLTKYPNCKELLEQYADAIHITSACEELQDFERGFRLGAAFMLDIFKD